MMVGRYSTRGKKGPENVEARRKSDRRSTRQQQETVAEEDSDEDTSGKPKSSKSGMSRKRVKASIESSDSSIEIIPSEPSCSRKAKDLSKEKSVKRSGRSKEKSPEKRESKCSTASDSSIEVISEKVAPIRISRLPKKSNDRASFKKADAVKESNPASENGKNGKTSHQRQKSSSEEKTDKTKESDSAPFFGRTTRAQWRKSYPEPKRSKKSPSKTPDVRRASTPRSITRSNSQTSEPQDDVNDKSEIIASDSSSDDSIPDKIAAKLRKKKLEAEKKAQSRAEKEESSDDDEDDDDDESDEASVSRKARSIRRWREKQEKSKSGSTASDTRKSRRNRVDRDDSLSEESMPRRRARIYSSSSDKSPPRRKTRGGSKAKSTSKTDQKAKSVKTKEKHDSTVGRRHLPRRTAAAKAHKSFIEDAKKRQLSQDNEDEEDEASSGTDESSSQNEESLTGRTRSKKASKYSSDSTEEDDEDSSDEPSRASRVKKVGRKVSRRYSSQDNEDESASDDESEDLEEITRPRRGVTRHQNIKAKSPRKAPVKKQASSAAKRRAEENSMSDEEFDISEEIGEMGFESSPTFIKNGTLREYQIRGLNWSISLYSNQRNGILADEMGLGKTIQSLSFMAYLKTYLGKTHFIVVAPKSTLSNWYNECKRFTPCLSAMILGGEKDDRNDKIIEWKDAIKAGSPINLMITNYEQVLICKSFIRKHKWSLFVIDEAHRIKNENTRLAKIVRTFNTGTRLLLTGTPLQNNLHELWALMNFVNPVEFKQAEEFDEEFQTDDPKKQNEIVKKLHKMLQPYMLRRLKVDVEKSLPPKKEMRLFVPLSKLQKDMYKSILTDHVEGWMPGVTAGKKVLSNMLMHLRKVANHPYLFNGVDTSPEGIEPKDDNLEHMVKASGKLSFLDRLLPRLLADGSKVLIFSQMVRVLDILDDYLCWKGIKYSRLDGTMSQEDRDENIHDFVKPFGNPIFLLSTRAGGLGLNLMQANIVILYDSDFNPQVDLQAIDRAHRIGQTRPVIVYRFISEHTVDEQIVARAAAKRALHLLVIQQGMRSVELEKQQSLNSDQLRILLQVSAQKFLAADETQVKHHSIEEDIDRILERSRFRHEEMSAEIDEATKVVKDKLEDMGAAKDVPELRFDHVMTNMKKTIDLKTFEGQNFREILKKKKEQNENRRLGLGGETFTRKDRAMRATRYEQRKSVNYAFENAYKRYVQKCQDEGTTPVPMVRQFTPSQMQFPPAKLVTLCEKEMLYFKKLIGYEVAVDSPVGSDLDSEDSDYEDLSSRRKDQLEENESIRVAKPLSDEELQLKTQLLKSFNAGYGRITHEAFLDIVSELERETWYPSPNVFSVPDQLLTKIRQCNASLGRINQPIIRSYIHEISKHATEIDELSRLKSHWDAVARRSKNRQEIQQALRWYIDDKMKRFGAVNRDEFIVSQLPMPAAVMESMKSDTSFFLRDFRLLYLYIVRSNREIHDPALPQKVIDFCYLDHDDNNRDNMSFMSKTIEHFEKAISRLSEAVLKEFQVAKRIGRVTYVPPLLLPLVPNEPRPRKVMLWELQKLAFPKKKKETEQPVLNLGKTSNFDDNDI